MKRFRGWYERPFRFWQCFATNEKDAQSFLPKSGVWLCGHWELVSGATGLDEKVAPSAVAGRSLHDTLFTRVHSPALSLTGCDDKMMTHEPSVLAEVLQIFSNIFYNNS